MVAWTWLALSAGWLPDRADQPAWFRFIVVRFARGQSADTRNWAGIVVAIFAWGFFNLQPIGVLLLWPYGPVGRLVVVASFAAQAVWALDLRRAIVRAGSRTSRREPR